MAKLNRTHAADLHGVARLAFEATAGIVDVVERMHHTIQRRPWPLGKPRAGSTRGITGFVYRTVRGSVRLIGRGVDASLAPVVELMPEGAAGPRRDALLAAINGVYGDYLARTGNPLAIPMSVRHRGQPVDPSDPADSLRAIGGSAPTGRVLLLVHGLCMNDLQWRRDGHDHGAALAAALGCTPLYLRYNSGLHVADNGAELAETLEKLVAAWPCPVEDLTILGHSMGGLVARSACHHAEAKGHAWPERLRKLVFLGTPHHGSPLERGGHGLDYLMSLSPYSAPLTRLGRSRSAGIRDLRHGTITRGKHRSAPLPARVERYAMGAMLGEHRNVVSERLVGDGLVPLDSALGLHEDPARCVGFPKSHQWIGARMGHLELLSRPEVYRQLEKWLRDGE
ncbi:MAG: esterase/lipase family protein [Betaproteobacteria bacterium]